MVSKIKLKILRGYWGNKYICLAVTTCEIETGRGWDQIINSFIPRTK